MTNGCFFLSFQDCYNCGSLLPRWDGDIYARYKARHSYQDPDWISGGGSPETCRTDIFSSHSHNVRFTSLPSSLKFSHTHSWPFSSPLHPPPDPLLIIGEEMLKCQSDSENFLKKSFHFLRLQPLNGLPSSPTTRSITFGIYLPGFHSAASAAM